MRFRLTVRKLAKNSLWKKQKFCVGIMTSKRKAKEKVGQVAQTEVYRLPQTWFIVSRGDWLWKAENIKDKDNAAEGYVRSSLTVCNLLHFAHKLWRNELMLRFYWSMRSKARFRRRTFHEPIRNVIHWIKYMRSSASESIRNACCFNLERLSRSFRQVRLGISPLERLRNGFDSDAERFMCRT